MRESFGSVLMAAQAGGEWAFAELYDEYNPLLERYFAARASSAAQDLAAETWLGAARRLSKFRGDEVQFRSWLFTIAHRRMADFSRDRKHHGWQPAVQESLGNYLAPDDTEQSVLDWLSGRAAVRQIAAVLPRKEAEVVLLRVVGGLGVEQVAKIMGLRSGTVRVLQHRALKKLSTEFRLEPVTD
jgi:RNA polymerase sigma-70 factor (ECF subfamily)